MCDQLVKEGFCLDSLQGLQRDSINVRPKEIDPTAHLPQQFPNGEHTLGPLWDAPPLEMFHFPQGGMTGGQINVSVESRFGRAASQSRARRVTV